MAPKREMAKKGKKGSTRKIEKKGKKVGKKGLKVKARLQKYGVAKPKRPASGYVLFVTEYSKGKNLKGKDLIVAAAQAWRKLTQTEKDEYNKRAAAPLEAYKKAMEDWQTKKQFLKQPPYSYGLFVHDFWKDEGQMLRQLEFADMSRRCANTWGKLSDIRKTEFKALAGRLAVDFQNCLQALDHGTAIDVLIRQSQAGAQAYAEDDDDELAGLSGDEMDGDEDSDAEESEDDDDEEEDSDELPEDEEDSDEEC